MKDIVIRPILLVKAGRYHATFGTLSPEDEGSPMLCYFAMQRQPRRPTVSLEARTSRLTRQKKTHQTAHACESFRVGHYERRAVCLVG